MLTITVGGRRSGQIDSFYDVIRTANGTARNINVAYNARPSLAVAVYRRNSARMRVRRMLRSTEVTTGK